MPNPVVHFEVTGKDGRKLQDFYSGVFGWKIDANNPMNYGMVDNQGEGIGGGISAGDGGRNQVTFYIAVDNPQAYLDTVESQGGKTVIPVTETPGKVNADNPMNYGVVDNQGEGIGGGISAGDGGRNQVTFYIAVDNPQAYLDTVESQGGKTVMPVTETPGMVILAQFADPEGNVVGLVDASYGSQQS